MNSKRIIAFAGRKRSGKTTLAKFLEQDYDAIVITIADYLKRLCCELMNMSYEELNDAKDNGYTFDIVPDERWFKIINKNTYIGFDNIKEKLENVHIKTIRELLQFIGTDVIRTYNPNWHVEKMIEEIKSYSEDKLIVIDDVRFTNEKRAIEKLDGEVFYIIRPSEMNVSNHISETALFWELFDKKHVIINSNMTLDEFKLHFKIHFANNFEIYVPKSIFLHENEEYLEFADFPKQNPKVDGFVNDIIDKIKNDKLFREFGIIRYKTYSKEYANRYIEEVDNKYTKLNPYCNEFFTFNPLITENIKKYL